MEKKADHALPEPAKKKPKQALVSPEKNRQTCKEYREPLI